MKTIKIDLPRKLKEVEILALADLHVGDAFCDLKLVKSWIEYVRDNEHVYCILNGDLMNNAVKYSVSNIYAETLRPSQQLDLLRELFTPIKHKILGITTGNHERRTSSDSDIDLMRTLAIMLDLEDRWADEGLTIFLRVGEIKNSTHTSDNSKTKQVVYVIYAQHQAGGGNKVNPALKLFRTIEADIIFTAHNHTPMADYQSIFKVDTKNNTVRKVDVLAVTSASTQQFGGYAQYKGYPPTSNRNPIVKLCGTHREFKVTY